MGRPQPKGGRCERLGNVWMKSTMELNYAAYLLWLKDRGAIADVLYEPKLYDYREWYQKGAMHYTPDFLVIHPDGRKEWHEVKGYLDGPSKTKLKRYLKHYGQIPVVLVCRKPEEMAKHFAGKVTTVDYDVLDKTLSKAIPGWK
jgi:hypothetical protein